MTYYTVNTLTQSKLKSETHIFHAKSGKICASESRLVLYYFWLGGASQFFSQLLNEVTQNPSKCNFFSILTWWQLGAPGDECNNFLWREGSPRLLKQNLRNLGLPSLQGNLLYSSPGAPSCHQVIPTASSRHFSRLTYKFYGACWLRVASWRCFSGFIV